MEREQKVIEVGTKATPDTTMTSRQGENLRVGPLLAIAGRKWGLSPGLA